MKTKELNIPEIREKFKEILNKLTNEEVLIWIAQDYESDNEAKEAMKQLREDYDSSYFYCYDCDGLVVKRNQCCINEG